MYHAPRNRVHVPGFGFQISPIIAGVFRLTCDNSRNAEWQHTCKCNCVARSRWVPGGAGPAAEPHRAFRSALTRGGGAVVRWWCNPNPATRSMHPATRPRLPVARCRVRRVAALRRCGVAVGVALRCGVALRGVVETFLFNYFRPYLLGFSIFSKIVVAARGGRWYPLQRRCERHQQPTHQPT